MQDVEDLPGHFPAPVEHVLDLVPPPHVLLQEPQSLQMAKDIQNIITASVEPGRSAEIGHIYRTRSAVLAEHSSVGRTIVRQKNSSVRFGSAEIGFGQSLAGMVKTLPLEKLWYRTAVT